MGKRFLVFGAGFENKGAQAMIFVTTKNILKQIPDAEIFLPVTGDGYDEYKFTPLYVDSYGYAYAYGGINAAKNYTVAAVKKMLGRGRSFDNIRNLKELVPTLDAMINISGYNLSSAFSMELNIHYLNMLDLMKRYNVPYYLMPQSFGPCDYGKEQEYMDRRIKSALSGARLIYAREKDGYQLLTGRYGLTNVILAADMVLLSEEIKLADVKSQAESINVPCLETQHNVGIIPNSRNSDIGNEEEIIRVYCGIIDTLLREKRTCYLMIHSSGDARLCKLIKTYYSHNNSVVVIDKEFSSFEFSVFVRQFDFLVASRYHSVVHAYKQGVPCLVMGWAVKYIEMMKLVGQEAYNLDVRSKESLTKANEKLNQMLQNYTKEHMIIQKKMSELQGNNCFCFLKEL